MKTNSILEAPDDAFVCYCAGVDKKAMLDAVSAGHDTVEKLKKATGICPEDSDCEHNNPAGRCCLAEVHALLRSKAGKASSQADSGEGSPACSCSCCGDQ